MAFFCSRYRRSQIRANWQEAKTRVEVAAKIEDANIAIEDKRVDEALRICEAIEKKANGDEKTQLDAIRRRAVAIQNEIRTKEANTKVFRLVSDCRLYLLKGEIDKAQSALEKALNMPMATEFGPVTKLANQLATKRANLADDLFDAGELEKAKQQAQQAIDTPSATETADAKRVASKIANREVDMLVSSAREALANMNRDHAASDLERALIIKYATNTDEA